jgi:peptidyl-prolyl cis-trans isomerase A (cyclophilin A)
MISTGRAVLSVCVLALVLPVAGLAGKAGASPQEVAKKEEAPKKVAKPSPGLLDPALANETAPDKFKVRFQTTKGDVVVEVTRAWAPNGADRFYNLVKVGFYDDVAFFRVIKGFMVQFGIHGDPEVAAKWRPAQIEDDKVKQSNKKGYITYAMAGPNTRTTQLFINYKNNSGLDGQGFSPIGRVVEGMKVVDSIYGGYGEGAPSGKGPSQALAQSQGNAYFKKKFPKLDYIKTATIVE